MMKLDGICEILILFAAFVTKQDACKFRKQGRNENDDQDSTSGTASENIRMDEFETIQLDEDLKALNKLRGTKGLNTVGWSPDLLAPVALRLASESCADSQAVYLHTPEDLEPMFDFHTVTRLGIVGVGHWTVETAVNLWISQADQRSVPLTGECVDAPDEDACEPYKKMIEEDLSHVACARVAYRFAVPSPFSKRIVCLFGSKSRNPK